MNRFSLTGFRQKFICLIIIFFLGTIDFISFTIFPKGNIILMLFLVLSILISIMYFYIIFCSAVIVNKSDKTIIFRLFSKTKVTLENVSEIKLEERILQNKSLLILVFYNDNHNIINTINTFFNLKQKKQAEIILSACKELIY